MEIEGRNERAAPPDGLTRRAFVLRSGAAAAGVAITASARSYASILGANDRVNFAVIGVHSRAYAHLASLQANRATANMAYACDVESTFLDKFATAANRKLGYTPKTARDFRRVLEARDVDAVTIATPDHWHAPMAIAALQAGKHVYVEKPCSFNQQEGEWLVAAQKKYGKLVQQGSQQRSSPHTIAMIQKIHTGLIGKAYMASAWYANDRKSIGIGKPAPVPTTLDWDLWQGPAPRRPYHDNYQPYNWHWFKHWGTGEAQNNGTHEVDICRWALQVDYPTSVHATGGRYAYRDDWEFYDTIEATWKFSDAIITWEGRSCNPMRRYGRDRGALILGTLGSVILDRDGYEVYDAEGRKTDDFRANQKQTLSTDTTGVDAMTDAHFANFIAGIQHGEALRSPVAVGVISVALLQMANVAWETGSALAIDPATGRIQNNAAAERLTRREYEPGWQPVV